METFLFAVNSVAPVVLLTALGYFLKRIGLVDGVFAAGANKLVFRLFLPIMVFLNFYDGGGLRKGDFPLAVFITAACAVMFGLGLIIVRLLIDDPRQKGVVLQCIFRSNFAIIGLPLAQSLAGEEGARLAAVAAVIAIPLFNSLAVISLSLYGQKTDKGGSLLRIVKGVITNPLIIGVFGAMALLGIEKLLALTGAEGLRLSSITPIYSALKSISAATTPIALIALGARFEFSAVKGMLRQILTGTLCRLIFMPLIVIGGAYLLCPQFGAAEFALLVSFAASPISVSSAVMAAEMDNDDTLAGQLVVWTTFFSMFTVFFIVLILRAAGIF